MSNIPSENAMKEEYQTPVVEIYGLSPVRVICSSPGPGESETPDPPIIIPTDVPTVSM